MIRVTIERAEESIRAFTLLGHADYAEPGQDIVCAGVSAVSFGTVNAIESLLKIEISCETDETDGLFRAVFPVGEDAKTEEQLQLLLRSMVVMLESIEESYHDYVTIEHKF